jgi:hypothetical protein
MWHAISSWVVGEKKMMKEREKNQPKQLLTP